MVFRHKGINKLVCITPLFQKIMSGERKCVWRSQQGQYLGKDAARNPGQVLATSSSKSSQLGKACLRRERFSCALYTCSQKDGKKHSLPWFLWWSLASAVPRAHEVCQGLSIQQKVETNDACHATRTASPVYGSQFPSGEKQKAQTKMRQPAFSSVTRYIWETDPAESNPCL